MTWPLVALIILVVGAVMITLIYFAASRIDRLHRRVELGYNALEVQLTRRAAVAAQLAVVGLWDPVTSIVVASAAQGAALAPPEGPEQSELSQALRQALGDRDQLGRDLADPDKRELLGELWQAWYRAQLARRFYNEAVVMTQRLRSRPGVRLFHLAGRVPMPKSCDVDDAAPEELGQLDPAPS